MARTTAAERQYERLLRRAKMGTTLTSQRVYYSARDPLEPKTVERVDPRLNDGRQYRGVLRRAHCVDVSDVAATGPEGVKGEVISFQCDGKPRKSATYRASHTHGGNRGLLRENVVCKVSQPFTAAKPRNPGPPPATRPKKR